MFIVLKVLACSVRGKCKVSASLRPHNCQGGIRCCLQAFVFTLFEEGVMETGGTMHTYSHGKPDNVQMNDEN